MNRRKFLTGAASGAAAFAGLTATGVAQGRAMASAVAQGGGGGRGGGSPANVSAAKLARIGMMTLNHRSILKLPWQEATPARTLDVFDLPQYYVDVYGVRNVEFQSDHVAQDENNPDLAYVKQLRASLDKAGAKANQINIEIGTMAQMGPDGKAAALAGEERAAWLTTAKKWVDLAPVLGVTRLMHNQGALTDDSKAGVISLWKELQDYARPKGIMISGETRGSGFPTGRGAPAPPKMSSQERQRYVWGILWECTQAADAYTNLDFGDAFILASMDADGSTILYSYDRGFDRVSGITRIEP